MSQPSGRRVPGRRRRDHPLPRDQEPVLLLIAHSELLQLVRNRAVLVASLPMPVFAAVFSISQQDVFERIGSLGCIERRRSTAADGRAILSGLVLPVTLISLLQVVILLGVLAGLTDVPAGVPLLVVAVVATFAMALALGVATAGVTRSPEHAQVTTLPLSLGVVAVASWVGITGTEDLALVKRLLPGGSATELVVDAWNGGGAVGDSLLLLAPTVGWVVLTVALASRMFPWEPRR